MPRRYVISDRIFYLGSLFTLMLIQSKPYWTCLSIWKTSSSAKSSDRRGHFGKLFLKYFYRNIFSEKFSLKSAESSINFFWIQSYAKFRSKTLFSSTSLDYYILQWFVIHMGSREIVHIQIRERDAPSEFVKGERQHIAFSDLSIWVISSSHPVPTESAVWC